MRQNCESTRSFIHHLLYSELTTHDQCASGPFITSSPTECRRQGISTKARHRVLRSSGDIPWYAISDATTNLTHHGVQCATGTKIPHFKKLHNKTGLPYSEMVRSHICPTILSISKLIIGQLFFDDEIRNNEVESLGVTFCLVRRGMDDRTFQHGLSEWRKQHIVEVVEDGDATA